MQSGYGVPEIHQLIEDDCSPPIFKISNNSQSHLYQLHHHSRQLQHLQQRKQPQQMFLQQQQPPLTHQLFHHQRQQQFHTFHQGQQQQQLGMEQQTPFFDVNFKLGLNENSETLVSKHDDNAFLQENVSGIRQHALVMPHYSWHSQADSAVKQQFWCNNKQCDEDKGPEIECNKNNSLYNNGLQQEVQSEERCNNIGNKDKHFGELEAIYNLASGEIVETNQTGSALNDGDNSPKDAAAVFLLPLRGINICETADANIALGSENSIGEEASLGKVNEKIKKRKRKTKENYSSMAVFFEELVKQVINHQEFLHIKFLEVVQRMDKEKTEREEAWKRQETAKHNREAIARAREQSIASNRDAFLVSCMEKITGQTINLPAKKTTLLLQPEVTKELQVQESTAMKSDTNTRWPKAEVEALILVRGGLQSRFLEPGLKGPLWEEVSSLMASMGYERCAKRCKEKWENINKYFRKARESGKKRCPQSKTCPYFDQLYQFYSGTPTKLPSCSSNPLFNSNIGLQNQRYLELLEDFVAERDLGIAENTSGVGNFNVSEMGSLRLNFDVIANDQTLEVEKGNQGEEKENHEDNKNS